MGWWGRSCPPNPSFSHFTKCALTGKTPSCPFTVRLSQGRPVATRLGYEGQRTGKTVPPTPPPSRPVSTLSVELASPGTRHTPAWLTWLANLCPSRHITQDADRARRDPNRAKHTLPPQKKIFRCFLITNVISEPGWRGAVCTGAVGEGGPVLALLIRLG